MASSFSSSTPHNCCDHFEMKSEETHFSCDGCKMNGFGPRYVCRLCGDKLHKECKNPKPTISHDFFGCSEFFFLPKPFTKPDPEDQAQAPANYCNACGKNICGFSYHCEARNLNLHPCCRNLEKKVKVNDNIVFELKPSLSSKCSYCNHDQNKGVSSSSTWSYVSSCKKFHFHVYCMMERVHIAKIKNGKVDLSEGGNFFEEIIKQLPSTITDIVLELAKEHGIGMDVFKKVKVSQLVQLLLKKCLINDKTSTRIVSATKGILKTANMSFDNASLHDFFEAFKSVADKLGSTLCKFFNFIAESLGKLVEGKEPVPLGVDRMV